MINIPEFSLFCTDATEARRHRKKMGVTAVPFMTVFPGVVIFISMPAGLTGVIPVSENLFSVIFLTLVQRETGDGMPLRPRPF